MGWRYLAYRFDGAGGGQIIDSNVPLKSVEITDVISGANSMRAQIEPEVLRYIGSDGKPTFQTWSTGFFAELDGKVRGGGILTDIGIANQRLTLDCYSASVYPHDQPYTDSRFFVEEDPTNIYRHIWEWLQSQDKGDLGVTLDSTTSSVIIGDELEQGEFDTQEGTLAFESGPYKLTWYQTPDLGKNVADLAEATPFDFRDTVSWDPDDEEKIRWHIEIGYPALGARRHDLRFAIGENINVIPQVNYEGDDYANVVMVLGAGEYAAMKRGFAERATTRLRRGVVVTDKAIRSDARCARRANKELSLRKGDYDITEVIVTRHPHAPIGSWKPGDEILVQGDIGWGELDNWCRVISSTISPDNDDSARLSVMRTDKVSS